MPLPQARKEITKEQSGNEKILFQSELILKTVASGTDETSRASG